MDPAPDGREHGDEALKETAASQRLVALNLPKKVRKELASCRGSRHQPVRIMEKAAVARPS